MRYALRPCLVGLCFSAAACVGGGGGGGSGGGGDATVLDVADAAVDAGMVTCEEGDRRVTGIAGPLDCAGEPDYIELLDDGRPFHIFTYEASHPLATADAAFPCARSQGDTIEAPDVETEACSAPGVRPWHSVRWRDADAACRAIGWRLCFSEELTRACGGESNTRYPYGQTFETGVCNVREAFRVEGEDFASESPTGHYAECVSEEGGYDLTGNLWEWTNERNANDPDERVYQGAGWKTVAERHRDTDLVCDVTSFVGSFSAPTFARATVGFRCCREAP